MVMWTISQPQTYTATATLQLDSTKARSPLLRNIAHPGHDQILFNILTSQQLLQDTTTATGLALDYQQFGLQILNNQLLRLRLQHTQREGLDQVLETHAYNFIHELLAPERFRAEQQLAQLEAQSKAYKEQLQDAQAKLAVSLKKPVPTTEDAREAHMRELIAQEFNVQRLSAQVELAQAEYNDLLANSKAINTRFDDQLTQGIIWFAEPSALHSATSPFDEQLKAFWQGLMLGLLAGFGLILLTHLFDRSISRDSDIVETLGLKILGRVPYLGPVRFTKGSAAISSQ